MLVAGIATLTDRLVVGSVTLGATLVAGTATLAATLVGGLVSPFIFSPTTRSSGVVELCRLWSGKEQGLTLTVWLLMFIFMLSRIKYVPMILLYVFLATNSLIFSWSYLRYCILLVI